jgi:hypothetical protein
MPRQQNEWSKRFGINRMATDRKLCEAAEAAIVAELHAREELLVDPKAKIGAVVKADDWVQREMGEQLEFERQKRESLK